MMSVMEFLLKLLGRVLSILQYLRVSSLLAFENADEK